MDRLRLFFPVAILFLPGVAAGQPAAVPSPAPVKAAAPAGQPAPPTGAKAVEAKTATASKESPRLQKLKQLQFDRRPSAILKAWAPAPPEEKTKPADPKASPAKPDPLDEELKIFQRTVTLGNWAAVKVYLAGLPEEEAKAGFQQMLQSLQGTPAQPTQPGVAVRAAVGNMLPGMAMQGTPPMQMQFAERNQFSPDDILGLAAAAPKGLDKTSIASIGGILRQALGSGTVVEAVVRRFKAEAAKPSGAALTARQAARLLSDADQAAEAGDFLPSLEKAQGEKDAEAMNLLARHFAGLYARENKLAFLEKAWTATQATLAAKASESEHGEALRRAVELAPKLRVELGQTWLEKSFTDKPERGMDILATIGSLASQGLQSQPMMPDDRLKTLQLQKTAVEALLKAAPARARDWRDTVSLLASAWLKDADFTYQFAPGSGSARMRRDRFGNIYWMNDDGMYPGMMMQQNPNQPRPVAVVDMLKASPGEAWLAQVRDDLRPKLAMTLCQLHLKVEEETKAFPFIEQLALAHPRKARDLVNEFLRVWTKNHDPNAARAYQNPYIFFYGFEQRANGIPLTRSKQERNLTDLASWVERIRKLPIGEPDEELLAKAFTTCHSSAEVYRSEAIEKVFGPMGGLKPKTLAGLAQQMRENLAGVWRKPEEQKDKKTNRKTKDIEAEVTRGYGVARAAIERALTKFPDDWTLVLARAAILHDEVSFQQELGKTPEFAPKRTKAYAEFQRAAALYAGKVKDLTEDDQSTKGYEQWFHASLGACDLAQVTEEKLPDLKQPALIRKAILALPGEAAEKHMARFANSLFTQMSAAKPAIKFRYLKGGFEIVGDHEQAAEAKKVYDYYKDLVSEIKLDAVIDGSTTVGHSQPFGVFVFLRHTRDIERESGGFGRYLQNQNANAYFAWNYGRPTADYRDKFQAAATEALKEHFDVTSVTFETDKVHSRATPEYGWRVTPYAYLLVKARGPQVDKLPPLRIDLDFLDTSGYAVLPIESAAVPLDARPENGEPRPARKLQITQILDERQASQGKLILEVKAQALGLVPDLDRLLTLAPEGFDVAETQDQGVSVSKFDQESDAIAVGSERTWLVTLKAKPDLTQPPQSFQFGRAKIDDATMAYQRYNDADLIAVAPEISLEERYGQRQLRWIWWAVGVSVATLVLALAAIRMLRRTRKGGDLRWKLPEPLTPFTTIGLLERIRHEGDLDDTQRSKLQESIRFLERRYFAADGTPNGSAELSAMAEAWIQQVPRKSKPCATNPTGG
jgi:hypothetical protein